MCAKWFSQLKPTLRINYGQLYSAKRNRPALSWKSSKRRNLIYCAHALLLYYILLQAVSIEITSPSGKFGSNIECLLKRFSYLQGMFLVWMPVQWGGRYAIGLGEGSYRMLMGHKSACRTLNCHNQTWKAPKILLWKK